MLTGASCAGADLLLTQIAKTFMYDAVAKGLKELNITTSSSLQLTGFDAEGGGGGDPGSAAAVGGPGDAPEGIDVVRVAAGATLLGQV